MMKKKTKGLFAVVLIGAAIFTSQAWADGASAPGVPGSTDDPVVTKSYVDQQIQQVVGSAGASSLQVVELRSGQTLYGYEGTEFIVRTGKVVSVAGSNGDGLTDLTGGLDLKAGAEVSPNHLLLLARSDNRGLRLAPKTKSVAYVMVRGKYSLK